MVILFDAPGRRRIVGAFDGGQMTSDGGAILLREADRLHDVTRHLAACFADHRDQRRIEHSVAGMIALRVTALALGHEDPNGNDRLRDRGHALAGSSTLNRLKLGAAGHAASDRYKRIVADPGRIDRLMVSLFLEMREEAPGEIILDMDATDDPVHGGQEGRFFHGHDRCHRHLPLYIFCGEDILCCRLRTADRDACDGAVDELGRIIPQTDSVYWFEDWRETPANSIRLLRFGDRGLSCRPGIACRNGRCGKIRFAAAPVDGQAASPTVTTRRFLKRARASSSLPILVAWRGSSMRRTSLS